METATNETVPYVQTCSGGAPIDTRFVGGKFSSLCRLKQMGLDVPNAICITTRVFGEIFGNNRNLDQAGLHDWSVVSAFDKSALSVVRDFVEHPSIPGSSDAVFVRSSATMEDQNASSFAGQFISLVGPRTLDFISNAVRECLGSFFSVHVDVYAQARNINLQDQGMAVVLQDAVPAEASGVVFTEDPILGPKFARVESSFGLGGPVMSGMITPDSFVVSLESGEIQKKLGSKRLRHDLRCDGRVEVAVTEPADAKLFSIEDRVISKLVEIAQAVARDFGSSQDVEFAIASDRIFLVQSRPITTRSTKDH